MISGAFWLVMCLWLVWMRLIVVVCPLRLSLLLSLLSPAVKSHTGKMKPNRGEKWNIDFFFFCLHFWWLFQASSFHASSCPFYSPAVSRVVCHHLAQCAPCLPHFSFFMRSRKVVVIHHGEWSERNGESDFKCFPATTPRVTLQLTCTWWPRTHKMLRTRRMSSRLSSRTVRERSRQMTEHNLHNNIGMKNGHGSA